MCIHFKLYLKDTDRYRYILSFVLSTGNKALSRSSKCSLRPWPPSYHWRTGDLQSRCHSKSMTLFFFVCVCDNWSWTCYAKWNVFFMCVVGLGHQDQGKCSHPFWTHQYSGYSQMSKRRATGDYRYAYILFFWLRLLNRLLLLVHFSMKYHVLF